MDDQFKTIGSESSLEFEPAAKLVAGTVLNGEYELLELLGRGGMGVVWKAKDIVGDRLVALKFVPPDVQKFESEMKRVREMFHLVHDLQHENICPLYALKEDARFGYYLVMKFLPGRALSDHISPGPNRKNLRLDTVAGMLTPVAKALDYAHQNKVIHRDIKPSNIFLVKNSQNSFDVQIIDFGLAAEIRSSMGRTSQHVGNISGTRLYMAPEQWRGRQQTAATDQYSLAVVAYELLAGHLPFEADDAEMLRMAVLQDKPETIRGLSEAANAALQKALSKDMEDRYPSCRKFIEALVTPVPVTQKKPMPPSNIPEAGNTPPKPMIPVPSKDSEETSRGSKTVLQNCVPVIVAGIGIAIISSLIYYFYDDLFPAAPSPSVAQVEVGSTENDTQHKRGRREIPELRSTNAEESPFTNDERTAENEPIAEKPQVSPKEPITNPAQKERKEYAENIFSQVSFDLNENYIISKALQFYNSPKSRDFVLELRGQNYEELEKAKREENWLKLISLLEGQEYSEYPEANTIDSAFQKLEDGTRVQILLKGNYAGVPLDKICVLSFYTFDTVCRYADFYNVQNPDSVTYCGIAIHSDCLGDSYGVWKQHPNGIGYYRGFWPLREIDSHGRNCEISSRCFVLGDKLSLPYWGYHAFNDKMNNAIILIRRKIALGETTPEEAVELLRKDYDKILAEALEWRHKLTI